MLNIKRIMENLALIKETAYNLFPHCAHAYILDTYQLGLVGDDIIRLAKTKTKIKSSENFV